MKFPAWLFHINVRHGGDLRRYEKGKTGTRIFVIVLLLALVAGTLGAEYWCIGLFRGKDTFLSGLAVLLLLVIPLAGVSLDYCVFYAQTGLIMFVRGTVVSLALKAESRKAQGSGEASPQNGAERTHRGLDLLIGILGILLALGLAVMLAVLPLYLLK